LIIQTILTYAVTSEHGFDLGIRDEFVVYAIYSCLLGLLFLLIALQRRNRNWEIDSSTPAAIQLEQSGNKREINLVIKAKAASLKTEEGTSKTDNVLREEIISSSEQESTTQTRST